MRFQKLFPEVIHDRVFYLRSFNKRFVVALPRVTRKYTATTKTTTKLAALFYNGKEACPFRTALEELGHTQPPTPIVTDNLTAKGIANGDIRQKISKAIDMRFYWIRDRVRQGQFIIYWRKGTTNKVDYPSKHHPQSHHRRMRPTYLHTENENYFDVLKEDTNKKNAQDRGEGVLITGNPETDCPGILVPIIENHKQSHNLYDSLFIQHRGD